MWDPPAALNHSDHRLELFALICYIWHFIAHGEIASKAEEYTILRSGCSEINSSRCSTELANEILQKFEQLSWRKILPRWHKANTTCTVPKLVKSWNFVLEIQCRCSSSKMPLLIACRRDAALRKRCVSLSLLPRICWDSLWWNQSIKLLQYCTHENNSTQCLPFFPRKFDIVTWISLSTRNIEPNVFPLLSYVPGARCFVNRAIWSHKILINLLLPQLGSHRAVLYSASDKKWHWRAWTFTRYFADKIPWVPQFRYSACRICLVSTW